MRDDLSVSLSSEDLTAIRQLLAIVTDNDLSELTITLRENVAVTIKCGGDAPPPVPAYYPPANSVAPIEATPEAVLADPVAAVEPVDRGIAVTAPMVGMFYHAASPGDPPFVKVGDTVKVGQSIGLIEAMKVFSEIPTDVAGRVTEIAVENGQLLQLSEPILFVEPM